jgi:hypothetical protein
LRFGLLAVLALGSACVVDEAGNTTVDSQVLGKIVTDPLGAAKDTIIVSKVENKGGGSESDTAVTYKPSKANCDDAFALTELPVDKFDEASGMTVFQNKTAATALLSFEPPNVIVIGNGPKNYKWLLEDLFWNFGWWMPADADGKPDVNTAKPIKLPVPSVKGKTEGKVDAESFAILDCGELNAKDPTRKCLVIANTDANAGDDAAVLVYLLSDDPEDPFKEGDVKLVNYVPVDTQAVFTLGTGDTFQPTHRLAFQAMTAYPVDDAFANRNGCGTVSTLVTLTCNRTLHPERGDTLVFMSRSSATASTLEPTLAFAMAPEVWRNNKDFLKDEPKPHILEYLGEVPLLHVAAARARAEGRVQEFLDVVPAGEHKELARKILTSNVTDLTVDDLRAAQSVDFGGESVTEVYERLFDQGWDKAHESDFFWALANQAAFFPIGQPMVISSYSGLLVLDVDVFALPRTQTFLALNVAQFIPSALPQTEAMAPSFFLDGDGNVGATFLTASEVEQNTAGVVVDDPDPQPMMVTTCTFVPVTGLKAK